MSIVAGQWRSNTVGAARAAEAERASAMMAEVNCILIERFEDACVLEIIY